MICDFALSLSPCDKALLMATRALVVPLSADNTTILDSSSLVIKVATSCILSGLPTLVPPNFIIFIFTGSFAFKQTFNVNQCESEQIYRIMIRFQKNKGICLKQVKDAVINQDGILHLGSLNHR